VVAALRFIDLARSRNYSFIFFSALFSLTTFSLGRTMAAAHEKATVTQLTGASVLLESCLPGVKLCSRGKVRDVYEIPGDRLLIVATDRLSAFDVVMAEGIPEKGRVLTQLSCFWFDFLQDSMPSHFLTADVSDSPAELQYFAEQLSGRSMLVRKAEPFPIECVVRGYLAGSGWKDYQATGTVCGIRAPSGLTESAKLDQPVFTPATKAHSGHDLNITFDQAAALVGSEAAGKLREYSLMIYSKARDYADGRGIIIADTKFEFGTYQDQIILIDEVLTPDSSRFWPKQGYLPGRAQPSFDKQFVRDYLESVHWNKQPPPPPLPSAVVEGTSEKYRQAYTLLTGHILN
jgi:phosphoribosylaminoimidazole-succinocarboxamide synthase